MAPRGALALLAVLVLPAAALAAPQPQAPACAAAEAAALPHPDEALALARASGLDLRHAVPLGPHDLAPEGEGDVAVPPLPPLPQRPPLPVNEHPCQGKIRPGAPLIIQNRYLCTANFVFRDEAGALYLGTAGHCIPSLSWTNIRVWGMAGDIGDPVWRRNAGVGHDFALIKIDPAFYAKVDPTMCRWGGPTGSVVPRTLGEPGEGALLHYGWGVEYNKDPLTRARAGALPDYGLLPNYVVAVLPVSPGDSGSGVQTELGTAAAIVTHTIILPGPAPPLGAAVALATRIDHALRIASAETGHTFEVVPGTVGVDPTGLTVP